MVYRRCNVYGGTCIVSGRAAVDYVDEGVENVRVDDIMVEHIKGHLSVSGNVGRRVIRNDIGVHNIHVR